ncbi:MAG: riboflavin biosynthesis protein RibF [Atribacterota bacterium]
MFLRRGWKGLSKSSLAIGFFDGLHLGHQKVLAEAHRRATPEVPFCVITFYPHPQRVLFPQEPLKYLTLYTEKYLLLSRLYPGTFLSFLRFGRDLRRMSPLAFLERVAEVFRPQVVCVGENFRFGFERRGTPGLLETYFTSRGVEVVILPSYELGGEIVSSSRIREYLFLGEVKKANALLGFPFFVMGKVRRGRQIGRSLGFPTLNLYPPSRKLLPPPGVYVGNVFWEDQKDLSFRALVYTGTRPTFQDANRQVVEIFVPHASFPELYSHRICVSFEQFVRKEMVFSSVDALKAQIQRDVEAFLSLSRGSC